MRKLKDQNELNRDFTYIQGLKYSLQEKIPPEWRTRLIDLLARAPWVIKRFAERVLDIPIASSVRFPDEKPLFIHIPKNAGTTIVKQLYGRPVGHRTASWYELADSKFFKSKTKIAFSRDPIDRFLSAYYFVLQGGSHDVVVSKRARAIVSRYESIIEFAIDFSSRPLPELEAIDPAFHCQSRYTTDKNGASIVDLVYKLEEIAGGKITVNGWTLDLTKKKNFNENRPDRLCVGSYPSLNEIVRKIYSVDYSTFEYD